MYRSIYTKRFEIGREVKLILFLQKNIFSLINRENNQTIKVSSYQNIIKTIKKGLLIESFHQKRIYNLPQGYSLKHKYPFIFICELSKP